MTEDKIVGWRHRLHGHELGQTLEDGEGQGSLVCCSPWGRKESDTTWGLNNHKVLGLRCCRSSYLVAASRGCPLIVGLLSAVALLAAECSL